jgi:hypothetical protein
MTLAVLAAAATGGCSDPQERSPQCGIESYDCPPAPDAEDDVASPEFPDATIDDAAMPDAPEAGNADANLDGDAGADGASDAPSDADGS